MMRCVVAYSAVFDSFLPCFVYCIVNALYESRDLTSDCGPSSGAPQPTSALPPGFTPPPPTPTPQPGITPVTLPPNETGFECNHGWTPVYNSNTPGGPDGGDLETLDRLRKIARFCNDSSIVTIECVDLRTGVRAEQTGQKVTCDKATGLTCLDKDQAAGACADYGVRFYCDCYGNSELLLLLLFMLSSFVLPSGY